MKVSVILPTYNDEKTIKKCLESLVKMKGVSEIIIVNDASTDSTEDEIKKVKSKLIKYYKNKKNLGTSKTKNIGASLAKGDILFFAEGDAYYKDNYIIEAKKYIKSKKCGGVIALNDVWPNKGLLNKLYHVEKKVKAENYKPISAWIFKKKVFEDLRGYKESLECGEDVDLGNRLLKKGYKIKLIKKVMWFHKEPESLFELIKRNIWQGENCNITPYNKKIKFGRMFDIILFISLIIFPFYKSLIIITMLSYMLYKLKITYKVFQYNYKLGIIFPFYLLLKRICVFIGVIKKYYNYIYKIIIN